MNKEEIFKISDPDVEDFGNEDEEVTTDEISEVIDQALEDDNHVEGVIVEKTEELSQDTEEKSFEDMLAKLGEAEDVETVEKDFTIEDFKRSFAGSELGMSLAVDGYQENKDNEEGINPKFKVSDESILKLLEVMNRVKNKENFSIFSALPDEVKNLINNYLKKNGMGGYSVQSNSARNALAKSLIEEFNTNISMDRTVFDLNKEIENLSKSTNKEMSAMFKDYETERSKYLENILSKIPEDDPKRAVLEKTLDSIYDAYKLDRLKEFVKSIKKFKSIEIEKPQQRIFNHFEDKYKDSQYKMYSLNMVLNILDKYNKTDIKNGNLLFMMAFARFCNNYNPTIPEEHAFMYYTVYNIILLDIYKDKDYEEFATPLLQNINEIINILGQKQYQNA